MSGAFRDTMNMSRKPRRFCLFSVSELNRALQTTKGIFGSGLESLETRVLFGGFMKLDEAPGRRRTLGLFEVLW